MKRRKVTPKGLQIKKMANKVKTEMIWLKKMGLTLDNIGNIYKISRQRVHAILKEKN